MDIDDLRIKQAEFEGSRQDFRKKVNELEEERKKFVSKYNIEIIKNMPMKDYVVGLQKIQNSGKRNLVKTRLMQK